MNTILKSLLLFILLAAAGFAQAPDLAMTKKNAEGGDARAQFDFGMMYHKGEGVPKDLVQAHVWWNIAGAKGHENAKKYLGIIEKEMTDSQKEKAMDLARELFAKLPKGK